jgi:hypothetical protein
MENWAKAMGLADDLNCQRLAVAQTLPRRYGLHYTKPYGV